MADHHGGADSSGTFVPPHPGAPQMPRWDAGELAEAPRFTLKNWAMMIGPGLVMGAAAIGGGEWLAGPLTTARYGGAILWLGTLSILGQVIYNIEISRYTLYCGEPIFTGVFRTLPGPRFWLIAYLFLDFGSFFPYLAANAATPLAAMMLGRMPDSSATTTSINFLAWSLTDRQLLQYLQYFVFVLAMMPMVLGGKAYNSMKALMSFKLVFVVGFLLTLAILYSDSKTWTEICTGFFKFGSVPVERNEDLNGNGVLDPGEDWDEDGHLDVIEEKLPPTVDANSDGKPDAWADINGDGKPDKFRDTDGDGKRDGENIENIFVSLWEGRGVPTIDLTMIAVLAALASISGQGGLTNTTISAYTRDQGWGMGAKVGAIPSMIGGQKLKLSHVGMVFQITADSVQRFRRWYRHILRDQLVVWMPACFIGLALPAMLSVQFLPRGVMVEDQWVAAGMTAHGVETAVGPTYGHYFWYATLFCGLLILVTSSSATSDGFIRRWVDVFWTGSPTVRKWDDYRIRYVFFAVVCTYTALGLVALSFGKPTQLLIFATMIYNYALGISCWHTLYVNMALLPRELRPGWVSRILLTLSGVFFFALALITSIKTFADMMK